MFCEVVAFVSGAGAALTVIAGTVWSTVIDVVLVPTLPALSVASTVTVFAPTASVPVANGDAQAANAATPSLQRYEAMPLASVALKLTACEAVTLVSASGAGSTVTTGLVWSTTIVAVSVMTFPALSVASTVIVLLPTESAPVAYGEVQAANAPAFSLQRYPLMPLVSAALKVMFCVVVALVNGDGAALTVSDGAVWSTAIVVVAVATLPALSVASTEIVLTPATSVPVA